MAHSDFAELTIEDLQGYYSDFHKDFHGWRPRGATPEQWRDRAFLVAQINSIHDAMDAMKATPQGREELRAAGWVFEDPEVIARSHADYVYERIKDYGLSFDCEVEAKAKDLAVIRYRESLESHELLENYLAFDDKISLEMI